MKARIVSLVAMSLMAAGSNAFAADGTINFHGQITAQTCTINGNGGGANFDVTLPSVSTQSLAIVGSSAGRTPFSISLTNCTPDSGLAYSYFEPGPTTTTDGFLVNTNTMGSNVSLRLLDANFDSIGVGLQSQVFATAKQLINGGSAVLPYYVEYVATSGPAIAGPVESSVMYTVVYE